MKTVTAEFKVEDNADEAGLSAYLTAKLAHLEEKGIYLVSIKVEESLTEEVL